jgi:hypothetical protein
LLASCRTVLQAASENDAVAGDDLLAPLREEVWSRSRGLLGREVPIVEQQVSDRSGIVGAAGLVMAPRP